MTIPASGQAPVCCASGASVSLAGSDPFADPFEVAAGSSGSTRFRSSSAKRRDRSATRAPTSSVFSAARFANGPALSPATAASSAALAAMSRATGAAWDVDLVDHLLELGQPFAGL